MKKVYKKADTKTQKRKIVLFPKGKTQVSDFLSIDFGEVSLGKKVAIGRYPLESDKEGQFSDLQKQIKPFLQKNLVLIPGIKTAFIKPKATNKVEFAIAVDYDKAKTFFQTAEELQLRSDSILSMDIIKMLFKTHLLRGGVAL